ncbi:hypothetical protein [Paenibacillus sp. DMB20]|uniref:hypothetical protein n=1 Tax=Paenibacillus sp. DMB20 TaxID=1642570 RepID=UPI000627B3B7|nr:hypothetical protein [Paenibacillus sp. DMB20]KKO50703.1 hypothetical protein XI25_30810 [Paenibacillus sp. DMB20]
MYNTKVVTGKIIEIRDDHVVTLHGDTVSTYHMRYYMMNEEPLPLTETEDTRVNAKTGAAATLAAEAEGSGTYRKDWKPFASWLSSWRKSARRA